MPQWYKPIEPKPRQVPEKEGDRQKKEEEMRENIRKIQGPPKPQPDLKKELQKIKERNTPGQKPQDGGMTHD
jgi:hypothetical protein